MMVSRGDYPQMAELFRLVKYYNLPRSMDVHHMLFILDFGFHIYLPLKMLKLDPGCLKIGTPPNLMVIQIGYPLVN